MHPLVKVVALVLVVALVPLGVGAALLRAGDRERASLDRSLSNVANVEAESLQSSFERGRAIALITAHNPSLRDFYRTPGTRMSKIRRGGALIARVNDTLGFLERVYPTAIGEVCFIDRSGPENARVVRGVRALPIGLSPDESKNPFFAPTFALPEGLVYQARPYVSPDTGEWVISNSTRVPGTSAITHFELTIESLRRSLARTAADYEMAVVDATTGRVVVDSARPQRKGAPLGDPGDRRFRFLAVGDARDGVGTVDGHRVALRRLELPATNANHWVVVALAPAVAGGLLDHRMLPLLAVLLATLGIALAMGRRWHTKSHEALTDQLTALGNRRRLLEDLDRVDADAPARLLLFDLDGFKLYNDAFGHPAGDALLARLGGRLAASVAGTGTAYRLGGDEFCVLVPADADPLEIALVTVEALSEHGEGFAIGCSHGSAELPAEARDGREALRLADRRLYAVKQSGRRSAGRQSSDVLLQALRERDPELGVHLGDVAQRAAAVAERLGLSVEEVEQIRQAGELHDVGKMAIPDAILEKPGPLDDEEWDFVRQHTLVGERIVAAAPALMPVARLVRASHERFDGRGYPDGLAGEEIPFGARIIAVCDAFDAMTSPRTYRAAISLEGALAELRRCAGTQFEPAVVAAFLELHNRAGDREAVYPRSERR